MTELTPGTRDWAEAEARRGAKVRCRVWSPEVWVTIERDKLLWQDGVFVSGTLFGCLGTADGWSIYEPAPAPKPAIQWSDPIPHSGGECPVPGDELARIDGFNDPDKACHWNWHRIAYYRRLRPAPAQEPGERNEFGDFVEDLFKPDLAAQVAELRARVDALESMNTWRRYAPRSEAAWKAEYLGTFEPTEAPAFVTSRKPAPMTDDEIVEAVLASMPDGALRAQRIVHAAIREAIRLTRASDRDKREERMVAAVKAFRAVYNKTRLTKEPDVISAVHAALAAYEGELL